MSNPIHLIVRLPYNRPPNAPREPSPVEWTSQKDQFLWEVLSRSRGPDSAGVDWQGLANHLGTPLPYLLFRAQARYEEDLRGLYDVPGALALNFGGGGTTTTDPPLQPLLLPNNVLPVRNSSTSLMQRVLSNQGGTPRLVPVRPSSSAVPTPQRLSTPVGRPGPSRRTSSPGHAPPPPTTTTTTPSRAPTTTTREHGTVGSESTMTLTQKPVGPAGAVASHSGAGARTTNVVKRPPPASEATMDSTSSSSSSSGDDEAERRREEAEETSNRLKELAKMMSSDMLGFARQQQPRASPSAVGGGLSSTTTPRSVRTAHDGSRSQSQASRIRQPSPSRGRQFGTASVIHEAATSRQPDQPTSASHYPDFSQRPQSIASRSKSGHDSIPSIPSPTESQSPARSSMSPTQSTSPSAGNPSRSPSMVSPADAMMQQQHAKRQSLDGAPSAMGTVRAPRSGGGAPVVQPGTAASASAQGRPRASKRPPSSTQGSSASSFSDISDTSISASALEEALMSNFTKPGGSRLSMFAPSQYGGGARGGSQQRL